MKARFLSVFLLISLFSHAREKENAVVYVKDSIAYSRDYVFKEGIYIDIKDFKSNKPLTKEQIITDYPKNQPDFWEQIAIKQNIVYKDLNGNEKKVNTNNVWGYSQNQSVYVNATKLISREYKKLNVIGSLCYYAEAYSTSVDGMRVNQAKQYVMNTSTGTIVDFNLANMENILKADPEIYTDRRAHV